MITLNKKKYLHLYSFIYLFIPNHSILKFLLAQPTKKHYFNVKVILKYYSGEYSKLGHYDIFLNMDYGSSQHIKLIFKREYFDKNMNKFF